MKRLSSVGEEHALKREVGWYGSFAMGYADVGADLYVAIGLVAFYAAGASPIAFASFLLFVPFNSSNSSTNFLCPSRVKKTSFAPASSLPLSSVGSE